MVTIDGTTYRRTPCGRLVPPGSESDDHACCLTCIVIMSNFPDVNDPLTSVIMG